MYIALASHAASVEHSKRVVGRFKWKPSRFEPIGLVIAIETCRAKARCHQNSGTFPLKASRSASLLTDEASTYMTCISKLSLVSPVPP